jgi:uncharacterized protein YabN with tetrapyrrole methylase and pyrophosphatase domain
MNGVRVEEAFDIYIVGLGIVNVRQITHEVDEALRRSREVLLVAQSFGMIEYLNQFCSNVTDLSVAYHEGDNRMNAYNMMTAKVIEASLDHPPVTFALYGHPLVFAWPPFQILRMAPLFNLRVKILPGISAMDCLFIDLKLDPAGGLQIYEATDILLRQRPLQPDVACLIWQIGAVETQLYSMATSKPERFKRIKNYLLKYYPLEHKVIAVYSSSFPLVPSLLTEFALRDFEAYSQEIHPGATLYIPPLRPPSLVDDELFKETASVLHLQEIVDFPAIHSSQKEETL